MNLSLRKAGTLLVAGLAFAACSPDSNDSPLSPPLGEQVAPAQDIEVRVCKVYRDLDAAGDYDFDVSVDGGEASTINLTAGNGIGENPLLGCVGSAVEFINITRGQTLNIIELAAAAGLAELESISIVPFPNCSASNDLENGETEILFDDTNCVEGSYTVTFKNLSLDDPPGGGEGCTPGGWRNNYDGSASPNDWWENNPLDPNDSFAAVWSDDDPLDANGDFVLTEEQLISLGLVGEDGPYTLLEALNQDSNRGGLSLVKHATAALLNSLDPDVNYPYTDVEVRTMFEAAFTALLAGDTDTSGDIKDMFDEANNLGCTQ